MHSVHLNQTTKPLTNDFFLSIMSEFFKAELKDRFLEYALERSDYFEIQTLYDEFLRPNYSLQYVEKLVREIQEYDSDLLDIMSGNGMEIFLLASTPSTQDFLDEGGFMRMYVSEEEKWDVFLDQLSSKPKRSNDEKKYPTKGATPLRRERTLLVLLLSAIGVSFVLTLYSFFKEILFEPEYVPADEFDRKVEQLEGQYLLENQRLRAELEDTKRILDSLQP